MGHHQTQSHWRSRLGLVVLALAIPFGASACYKNAGENLEPTSNRVQLQDLTPSRTPTATVDAAISPTPSRQPLQATPTSGGPGVPVVPALTPTGDLSDILPTRAEPGAQGVTITTPSMSDIIPTPIPTATIDPTLLPPPTPLPPGMDPCLVVVASGDTLLRIAQKNEVAVPDLIAANPTVLTMGEFTTLQIGWELRLPGCGTPVPAAGTPPAPGGQPAPGGAAGLPTIHTVQSGDTVYSIGRQYGVDPQAIINANGLANPNALSVGQQLTIPAP
ncbi:MAG: LysM peptidoglycan-binding domain-containing protein [Anaerolineae bacterium]|nr:LysM peptidoglycan-binding domain-containing protein [Anaerolineae bacterium]